MGPGIQSVKHLGGGPQRRIQVTWADGRMGFLVIGKTAAWLPFYATVTTERSATQFQPDIHKLYRALLESCLPYLAGNTDQPPVHIDHLIEAELAAVAALKSWTDGDVEVHLASLREVDNHYDGPTFAAEYRQLKYPTSQGKNS
jgi:hypothetical protein